MKERNLLFNFFIIFFSIYLGLGYITEAADTFNMGVIDVREIVSEKSPIPLKLLPKDKKGVVDWDGAVKKGIIKPLGILYPEISDEKENSLLNLDVLIKNNDGTPLGVLFSHKIHTFWFDCDGCHSKIYKKEKGSNPKMMTMEKMKEGESCGKCHNSVAFSMNNCDRCHMDKGIKIRN